MEYMRDEATFRYHKPGSQFNSNTDLKIATCTYMTQSQQGLQLVAHRSENKLFPEGLSAFMINLKIEAEEEEAKAAANELGHESDDENDMGFDLFD